jgi:putative DNA primase/helicase
MAAHVNYDDVLDQLKSYGLDIESLEVGTDRPKRCRERDGDREQRGWYWLSDITIDGNLYIVGSYGIYHGNDPGKQKVLLKKGVTLTEDQRRAIAARHSENAKRAKAIRQREAAAAAAKASRAWGKYLPAGESEYLARKGVGAHGIRFAPNGNGTIAIPMCDAAGRIHGLQIIRAKRTQKPDQKGKLEKEYWPKGLIKQGHYHLIGSPRDILLIAEGYATAATLHSATGLPVAVAFDAGNLLPVAQAVHKTYRSARILICADDDYQQKCKACGKPTAVAEPKCSHCGEDHGQTNPGETAAQAAALAVGGAWVKPDFPFERNGQKLTDFNDLAQAPEGGAHRVAQQITAALERAGWAQPKAAVRGDALPWGAGEGQSRRKAVSVLSLDDAVQRFVPLDDGTGKYLFDLWTNKVVLREQMVALLPAGIRWDDVKRHPTWAQRGAYYLDQVGFDPTLNDKSVELNTWRGWPMQPREGSCERLLELVYYLCNNEPGRGEELTTWLLRWMAYPLQHPGTKMSSAVIMHGPQGTGKSAVFQTLAKIYGDYATVLNQRGLEDKFNSDWADSKLFILAEEVVTRAEMWHIKNELKELVTGEWIRVNPKNVAAYRQRNQVNIVYLSNEGQPLPLENDDRRHLVIWTPPMLDETFYDEVWQEIENGGTQAFYHHLLNLDLGDFHPKKRPPMTEAKRDLIELSMPSEERFLSHWRAEELPWPFCPCSGEHLYKAYSLWCKDNGVRNPRESNQFLGRVHRMPGWKDGPQHIYGSSAYTHPTKKRLVVPDERELERIGGGRPENKTKSQWLTDCFFRFKEALESSL